MRYDAVSLIRLVAASTPPDRPALQDAGHARSGQRRKQRPRTTRAPRRPARSSLANLEHLKPDRILAQYGLGNVRSL